MPAVSLTITPFSLNGEADMALMNVNGQIVQSQQVGGLPVSMQWPGSMAGGTVSVTLTPEIPGRVCESSLKGRGPSCGCSNMARCRRRWTGCGRASYRRPRCRLCTIQVGSAANPFFLPALTQFACPAGSDATWASVCSESSPETQTSSRSAFPERCCRRWRPGCRRRSPQAAANSGAAGRSLPRRADLAVLDRLGGAGGRTAPVR